MKNTKRLEGLIAATYTPFHADGSLKLDIIRDYVDYLVDAGMAGLYVCGSTGEGVSLSVSERKQVAEAFVRAAKGRIPTAVQVGANCLADCRELAAHAEACGADAMSANAPSYFKITDTDMMLDYMAEIAAAAPSTPFYYYHIPFLTGATIDIRRFLEQGERIPTLDGIKYSDLKVFEFQDALEYGDGRYEMLWGCDEMLLSALVVGARGGVGSTYAQIPGVYRGIVRSWQEGRRDEARRFQLQSVEYVKILCRHGNLHSAQKAVLRRIGFDVGACRLPLPPLPTEAEKRLFADLDILGIETP